MKIEWKEQGGPDVEAARVVPNPMGMCVEVSHRAHDLRWTWEVFATTPNNCEAIGGGHEATVFAAKRAAEVRAVEILTALRSLFDAVIGGGQ